MTSQIAGIDILHTYWVRWPIYANTSRKQDLLQICTQLLLNVWILAKICKNHQNSNFKKKSLKSF